MTTVHQTVNWTAGDDWQINATLLDENGVPFNLGDPTQIKWALMDNHNKRALDQDDCFITIVDAAAGKCAIHIPAVETSPLCGGRYVDVVRFVQGGISSTLSYGLIYVAADPWIQPEAVNCAALAPHTSATIHRIYRAA